jgi:hypothetical protein
MFEILQEESVNQLLNILVTVTLSHMEDIWKWNLNPEEDFSVKSAYDALLAIGDSPNLSEFELKIFSDIWESPAPSKMVAFSWKILYDRIPTKDNLLLIVVLQQGVVGNCVMCDHVPKRVHTCFFIVMWLIGHGTRFLNGSLW